MAEKPPNRRRRSSAERRDRKDRLIQTRVAGDLEQALKEEAAKRRLTVSHLIRNTLEDTFTLVDDVEQIVTESVELAKAAGRDAKRIASIVRRKGEPKEEAEDLDVEDDEVDDEDQPDDLGSTETPEPVDLGHIYGWNRVISNRPATCAKCATSIERGDDALVGLSDDPSKPRTWMCVDCADDL